VLQYSKKSIIKSNFVFTKLVKSIIIEIKSVYKTKNISKTKIILGGINI